MTGSISSARASTLWIVLLTVASTAATFVLACAAPFSALAALAAVHMRRRDGIVLVLCVWLVGQAVGFGFLDYPHDPKTLTWALGLGTAAVGSVLAAYCALGRMGGAPVAARLAVAYLAGFVGFKAVVLFWASILGGVAITLHPIYSLDQFFRNGAILIALYALYRGLVALGVPPARPAPAVA
ncbi:MAG: hypothetical protein EOP59_10145 [Sphingomonadales bacterium]|nr:MAG: hypothetical protein EOP59_10145 [Sphingomonadales bacterium]